MINKEKYLEWMEEYFNSITSDKNIDIKKVLSDVNNEGKLSLTMNSLYTID